MAKTKTLEPAELFINAQGAVEEAAMSNFHEAVRRAMPEVIEKAITDVASTAFADGVEWANNTPITKRERKMIA